MNPDRELVEAVLARRAGAFERLVAEHQGLCWHIIQRLVRHPEDTRELCQETFLRVYQYLHQYRYESALKSWIGRVAYAVGLGHLERRQVPLLDEAGEDRPTPRCCRKATASIWRRPGPTPTCAAACKRRSRRCRRCSAPC